MAIVLTESAATEIQKVLEAENRGDDTRLRVGVNGGGCSGLTYSLNFDTDFDPKVDTQFEQHGVKIVTTKKFSLHLDGATVDFRDGPAGRGFAVDNPNQPSGGGCPGCGG